MSRAALPVPEDSSPLADDAAADAPRAPRRARGQLRVEALLAAAAEVFALKGFDAATMTEIAAQSESSIGSLYQFFRTKEAVADALVSEQVDGLWQRLDSLGERAAALATADLGRRRRWSPACGARCASAWRRSWCAMRRTPSARPCARWRQWCST
jgi:AcrR family transcriptional regulator